MKLYRAVSTEEYEDLKIVGIFRTSKNTLEAKQFFKSEMAVLEFVRVAVKRSYEPPYRFILIIDIDIQRFEIVHATMQNLDGYDAVTIQEDDLPSFNNCIIFVVVQNV